MRVPVSMAAMSPMGAYVTAASARVRVEASDPAVKQALEAFDTSMRGAVAIGFTGIRTHRSQVRRDTVVLATVATDEHDDDEAPDKTRVQ